MPLLHREKKNEEEETSRPRKRWKFRLWPIVLFLALMAGSFIMGAVLTHQESEPVITADLLGQQLRDIQELSTVEYHYTNMGRFENQKDFYGWKVPFTTKSFIVAYDGVIKAGVDLSEMKIEVSGKTITVTMPEAKVLSHEMDEESLEVYDETHNIFNPIEIEDYTQFTADQKESIEARALDNGLLTSAAQRAENTVRGLIEALPGMEEYTLTIV
ncbi:MAG TPA: DUF4230 domain-containing protein [Candidatus Flavonifractor merdipullorum]|uniref:DUF4230 domain-containing protein n=1 Tax=Candidatus Flavonifractor merdipullorum TaxID=2838590 RepID=A0A9D1RSH3_9FIRM|nr:DUF4230 domain-containing protein [Candidatus Flavonifractor merdipullorum]